MAKRKREDDEPSSRLINRSAAARLEEEGLRRSVKKTKLNGHNSEGVQSSPAAPTFLGLPGELRNRIYRFALLVNGQVEVNKSNYMQPGLLRASKQLRMESCKIFHEENAVHLIIYNMKFEPQPQHWIWTRTPEHQPHMLEEFSTASWDNLKDWLRRRWEGDGVRGLRGCAYERARIFTEAFNIVDSMANSPWSVVEQVLEAFRRAVNFDDAFTW
ncbi:hypothetical protein LTR37_001065 [Vermiconidia calcicola]|uniref:Uncharacterized protein n=1 Tax=Vermiconidia calcicola TaxID=1690605 RepID=A0ACC3NX31_9PEZI|nr:hypothetical protein LTR37_001065 [Vermiconidia calcicola]